MTDYDGSGRLKYGKIFLVFLSSNQIHLDWIVRQVNHLILTLFIPNLANISYRKKNPFLSYGGKIVN